MKWITCFLFGHKWTSKAQKGFPPKEEQIKSVNGFADYAKMFCDRCGYESKLNKRLKS